MKSNKKQILLSRVKLILITLTFGLIISITFINTLKILRDLKKAQINYLEIVTTVLIILYFLMLIYTRLTQKFSKHHLEKNQVKKEVLLKLIKKYKSKSYKKPQNKKIAKIKIKFFQKKLKKIKKDIFLIKKKEKNVLNFKKMF